MDNTSSLQTLGFTLPSPAYIAGSILFGLIGFGAYRVGKVSERSRTKWLGITLMFYPYVVPSDWLLYGVGIALCIGLYLDRG